MTQVSFWADTTATTCAAGGVATTLNMLTLPDWAPEIAYVGTTDPWLAQIEYVTTSASAADGAHHRNDISWAKVRSYKTKAGKQVIGLSKEVAGGIAGRPFNRIIVTYRAVGELVRT